MIAMSNITPKEPIVVENINLEQTDTPITNGISLDDKNQTSNISTSAVVGIAVEKRYGNNFPWICCFNVWHGYYVKCSGGTKRCAGIP